MNEEEMNTQTSLAGGSVIEEEKLRQAKNAEMQKKYRIISRALVGVIFVSTLMYLFTAQKCLILGHKWQAATCTTAQFCTVCSVVDGEALGHTWQDATCTTAKVCMVCDAVDGKPLGHTWQDATCTTPKVCMVCDAVDGKPLGHAWQDATCTTAKTCMVCDVVDGKPLGHNWKAATCVDPRICSLCSDVDGVPLGHSWPKTDELANCSICNHPNGKLKIISDDLVASSWSDQKLALILENGRKSDPTILLTNSVVEKCYGLTLCLRINELTAGNVLGEWGFYIRDLNGQWHLADTFTLDGDYVEAHLKFDEPISFDAWACPCHVLGDYWNFSFSVWLENATVFEYTG